MSETLHSEGHRALLLVPDSSSVVADRIQARRDAVSDWRRGVRVPSTEARARLHAAYGIPVSAWDEQCLDDKDAQIQAQLASIVEAAINNKPTIEPLPPRKRTDLKGMWKCSSAAEREAALKMAKEGVPIKNIAIALGRCAPTITAPPSPGACLLLPTRAPSPSR